MTEPGRAKALRLVDELRRLGVKLSVVGHDLKARAPTGTVTRSLREAIALHYIEIVRILRGLDADGMALAPDGTAAADGPRSCLVSLLFSPTVKVLAPGIVQTLGRDPMSDIRLPSEEVSRHHAELHPAEDGRFELRDLGSRNGTSVNGARIERRLLEEGDQIRIGPFRLDFREVHGEGLDLASAGATDETADVSRRPGIPRGGLAGTFDGAELLQVCQLIFLNERTGTLHIESDAVGGWIAFERGEIVSAAAGVDTGRKAALEILSISRGWFEFAPNEVPASDVRLSTGAVLVEAARRRDEWEDLTAILGELDERPVEDLPE